MRNFAIGKTQKPLTKMKKIILMLGFVMILVVGCGNNEYSNCMDKLADSICKEKDYSFGESSRALAGNVGDYPRIYCYKDERDIYHDTFKFLQEDINYCKESIKDIEER